MKIMPLIGSLLLWAVVLALPALAQDDEEYVDNEPLGQSTIYVYENGQLVGYSVGEDFEFYEVEDRDIMEGNADLLKEFQGDGSNNAVTLGASAAQNSDRTFNAEQGGAHPEGVLVHGLAWQRMQNPGEWQQFFGEWTSEDSYSGQYDYSSARGNLDASFYSIGGYAYGIASNEAQDAEAFTAERKSRRSGHAVWRQGSAEGGVWTIEGTTYKVNTEGLLSQVSDVDLKRIDANFRMVECGIVLKGGACYGSYDSKSTDSSNSFVGARVGGDYCLAPDLMLNAAARVTSTSADTQSASMSQSDINAGLSWELSDSVTVVGEARSFNERNDLAANTHLTGYDDIGARLEVHPASGTSVSLGWRYRNADLERLHFGNLDVGVLASDRTSTPSRDELAPYRESDSASSDLLSLNGQWRVGDRFYIGANWDREEFDSLPAAENLFDEEAKPAYLGDSRSSASLHLSYDTGCGGNLSLRGDEWSRSNGPREAGLQGRRISLGYGAPLTSCTRWGAEISRSRSSLDLAGDLQDWDASSWNYGLSLSGYECWASYRISLSHQLSDGMSGGDYDSVGLELNLCETPIYLAGWWRERKDALGGFADYDDSGLSVGYRIDL